MDEFDAYDSTDFEVYADDKYDFDSRQHGWEPR